MQYRQSLPRGAGILLGFLIAFLTGTSSSATDALKFGFSRVDITPDQPIRLSGYGNRDQPSEGVDEKLFVRAMVIAADSKGDATDADPELHVLLSVETIGFPGNLTQAVFEEVREKYALSRSQLVTCSTHSHTSPHIDRGLNNLFSTPLSEEEQKVVVAYTDAVKQACVNAIHEAVMDLKPGRMFVSHGKATFARHRRVIKDGVWSGFGVNPNGPVDHALPVIRVTDATGNEVRGLLFNYACHCTTFGGDYNRVNGDWAGYAMKFLESEFEGACAMCTIGCGADANPDRDPQRSLILSQSQAREISDEVSGLMDSGQWMEISADRSATDASSGPVSSFGFAGLPLEHPTDQQLNDAINSPRPQVRQHAQVMLATKQRMGRLPETFPMPVQVWRFGTGSENQFAMVFLGGEVCVEYALRLKSELASRTEGLNKNRIWVSAYCNDVFGYVAPERMQSEGGYEVDFSMIYYLQPGRWSSGTEEIIIRRVHELFDGNDSDRPKSIEQSLRSFQTADGLLVRMVASEPLIQDPVNFCIDATGRLWVVEMGDYPRGDPAKVDRDQVVFNKRGYTKGNPWDGPPGGRIKVLSDSDQDGVYDRATVFLDGLRFPTGVFPWKEGVIYSAGSEISFARDNDGDDKCDDQEVLFAGFDDANPQHRVNGFEWGLDGWLYLAAGNRHNGTVTCLRTGETINTSGRDIRIHPDSGKLELCSGDSQWGRCRDDLGNWFGNDNTRPLGQYVIEDFDLQRNPHVISPSPRVQLTNPPQSPPVFPISRTLDRFNDLATHNRFTSACGPAIHRNASVESKHVDALICEPVHNLISRYRVDRSTIPFSAIKSQEDEGKAYLASTDNWFRPVRIQPAPNGEHVWVCDMYRLVIEHPEWIPEAWQQNLDLYAGSDHGRIYAVVAHNGSRHRPVENLDTLSEQQLVSRLTSSNAWQRDTAQRLLLERLTGKPDQINQVVPQLATIVGNEQSATASRVQALWTLWLLSNDSLDVGSLLEDQDAGVVVNVLRAAGAGKAVSDDALMEKLVHHPSQQVRLELALALGDLPPDQRGGLAALAVENLNDPWMRAAILSSANGVAPEILVSVIEFAEDSPSRTSLVDGLVSTALAAEPGEGFLQIAGALELGDEQIEDWQMAALNSSLEFLARKRIGMERIEADDERERNLIAKVDRHLESAVAIAIDSNQSLNRRILATRLAGYASGPTTAAAIQSLAELLQPRNELQLQFAAIQSLAQRGAVQPLLEAYAETGPQAGARIMGVLLSRDKWTEMLVESLERKQMRVDTLTPSSRETLKYHRDEKIRQRVSGLLSFQDQASRSNVLSKYEQALSIEGNVDHGRKIFETHCAVCHRLGQIGQSIGPDLATLQNKDSRYILTSLFDPSRAIESKYRGYRIATSDGRFFSGMVLEEASTSIKIALADGTTLSFLRSEIEDLSITQRSFMPEGFENSLNVRQTADLLRFIEQNLSH